MLNPVVRRFPIFILLKKPAPMQWCSYFRAIYNRTGGILIFSSLFAMEAAAQDFYLSQPFEMPSLLNPALCGANGPYRLSTTYRSQQNAPGPPTRLFGGSIDVRFNPDHW